jgi:hypothetical protein
MARFRLGRAVSIRWNGLIFEGPALTVFEVPDEYNDELESAMIVEPTFEWLDSDEGDTIRDRLDALEAGGGGGGAALSNDLPLALGTASAGTGTEASRDDHVHPTTGLSLSSHNHNGTYDPAGTAASAVAAHVAAADPHSIYLTDAEGDAQYSQLGHTHALGEASFTTVIKQYVKNTSGASIAKGNAVYVSGATGTNVTVALADYDTDATSSKTLGLMETTVAHNGFGYVVTEGILAGFDTTAASTEGVPVWLGAAGGLIYGTAPSEPYHTVYIGIVSRKNSSNGEVFIKVQNGYELTELHDVMAATPADNDLIQYDSASGYWKNETLANAGIATSGHTHTGPYTPTAHASTHNAGGSDALSIDAVAGTGSLRTLGTTATSAAAGNHLHTGVYDPAGTAASAVSTHEADTTSVHGIADTSALLTTSTSFANISTPAGSATTITSTTAGSPTDITGLTYTFTPTYNEDVFVQQNLVVTQSASPASAVNIIGKILVNGTAATPFSYFGLTASHGSPNGWTQGMSHTFVASSGVSYTVKCAAYKSSANGTYSASNGSTMSVIRVRA